MVCREGHLAGEGGGAGAAWEGDGVVAVLALVGGDDDGGVVRGALHALLHCALVVGAPVVAPTHVSESHFNAMYISWYIDVSLLYICCHIAIVLHK